MPFDFEAAVAAPFRMQPGLRRMAPGTPHLTPLAPGSRHQREKLAVLSAYWPQALCAVAGFDAAPALQALSAQARQEHPQAWQRTEGRSWACGLGTAVDDDGTIVQTQAGAFGLGDEVARCLALLPPAWRQAGLLHLAFAEDFAVVDGRDGTLPWIAAALPSHWAPADKLGRHFTEVHAPVADNTLLLQAAPALLKLVTGHERWERFVWNVTDQPRLHAHPERTDPQRWQHTAPAGAWFRSEHQTFIPLPGHGQAVFTIHVDVQPMQVLVRQPGRAAALHAAIASMSPAVLGYRNLAAVRGPLLDWLAAQA